MSKTCICGVKAERLVESCPLCPLKETKKEPTAPVWIHCKKCGEESSLFDPTSCPHCGSKEVEAIKEPTEEGLRVEVAGAVARGWCSKENEHKVMDADLAYAIVDQIMLLLARERSKLLEAVRGCVPTEDADSKKDVGFFAHWFARGFNECREATLEALTHLEEKSQVN